MTDRPLSRRCLVGLLGFVVFLLALAAPDAGLAQGICVAGVPGLVCPPPSQSPPSSPPPDGGGGTTGGAPGAGRPLVEQRSFVGMVSEDTFGGNATYRKMSFPLHRGLGIGTLRQPFIWAASRAGAGAKNRKAVHNPSGCKQPRQQQPQVVST